MTIAATTVFRREALVSFTDGVAATFAVVPLPASSAAFTIAFCDFATALTVCNTVLVAILLLLSQMVKPDDCSTFGFFIMSSKAQASKLKRRRFINQEIT